MQNKPTFILKYIPTAKEKRPQRLSFIHAHPGQRQTESLYLQVLPGAETLTPSPSE